MGRLATLKEMVENMLETLRSEEPLSDIWLSTEDKLLDVLRQLPDRLRVRYERAYLNIY